MVPARQICQSRFHTYTIAKGLTLSTHKTNISSSPRIFHFNGTPLENVQGFKYLGITLSHNGRMTNASTQMARNFASVIASLKKS